MRCTVHVQCVQCVVQGAGGVRQEPAEGVVLEPVPEVDSTKQARVVPELHVVVEQPTSAIIMVVVIDLWPKFKPEIVTDIIYLNLAIVLTILGGAAPLLVDVILAWLSRGDGGWGWSGTYLHQYLQK